VNPALWGTFAAFSWGGADFTARFTSRALGHENSLLGMLAVGSVVTTAWLLAADAPLVWRWSDGWLLVATGVCVMAQTLLLYEGLARGPVSVVAPIVGCYPALVVLIGVLAGARPTLLQWAAMAVVMAGVVVVGRAAEAVARGEPPPPGGVRRTLAISAAAAVVYALGVSAGQAAAPTYGELETLWASRVVGLASLLPLYLLPRFAFRFSLRWSPAISAQGLLDAGAYLALFAAGRGEAAEIAAVAGSAFGSVTAVLARVFLQEPMTRGQWAGIALIFGGVALLTAEG
jgi:drug/metabolite transporter (DMT)-like permease